MTLLLHHLPALPSFAGCHPLVVAILPQPVTGARATVAAPARRTMLPSRPAHPGALVALRLELAIVLVPLAGIRLLLVLFLPSAFG